MKLKLAAILVFPWMACLLVSCKNPASLKAVAGEGKRTQVVRFKKLFDSKGVLYDLVLVTRDFREEMALREHTTLIAYRGGKYALLDVVTFDRKHLGKDRIRHTLVGLWPVDLRDDPTNRSLLLAEAKAEFLTVVPEGDAKAYGPPPAPDIMSLEVRIRFVDLERNGEITVKEPKGGEVGRGIALLLGASAEKRLPMHWTLMLQYHLAERSRESGQNTKAARAYQRIIETVSHIRSGPDADAYDRTEFDLRNFDYVASMADKRASTLK